MLEKVAQVLDRILERFPAAMQAAADKVLVAARVARSVLAAMGALAVVLLVATLAFLLTAAPVLAVIWLAQQVGLLPL
jgi:hypothetical protein